MSNAWRARFTSRVILRWKWAGMPVMRRGRIFPLSVTNFFRRSGFFQSMASSAMSTRRRGIVRFARRKLERRCGVFGWLMTVFLRGLKEDYLISRCNVRRRRFGLYLTFSNRFGVLGLFLLREEM